MPSASKKLSLKQLKAKRKSAREYYYRNKVAIKEAQRIKALPKGSLNSFRGLPPIHVQAAAKRTLKEIEHRLHANGNQLDDLIVSAYTLAKAVLS
jgi:hypothetical protein